MAGITNGGRGDNNVANERGITPSGERQHVSVTMRSGRRIFVTFAPGAEVSSEDLIDMAFETAILEFVDDVLRGNEQGIEVAINNMVNTLIPAVAMKTGRLRAAIVTMLHNIQSGFTSSSAILLPIGLSPSGGNTGIDIIKQRNIVIAQQFIDFAIVFGTLNYAVYHALEFRKKDVYEKPSTGGTRPYSIAIFMRVFIDNMIEEIINYLILTGWDLTVPSLNIGSIVGHNINVTQMGRLES